LFFWSSQARARLRNWRRGAKGFIIAVDLSYDGLSIPAPLDATVAAPQQATFFFDTAGPPVPGGGAAFPVLSGGRAPVSHFRKIRSLQWFEDFPVAVLIAPVVANGREYSKHKKYTKVY
jgi:hypothetical protein